MEYQMDRIIETKLEHFKRLMLEKLQAVAFKHGGMNHPNSVTSNEFDWTNPDSAFEVREHLLKEIGEWLVEKDASKRKKELIDIANCSFILFKLEESRGI